jgi:hypothetical protein
MSVGLPDEGATGSVHFAPLVVDIEAELVFLAAREVDARAALSHAMSFVPSQSALHMLDESRGTDDLSRRVTDLNHEVVVLRSVLPNACRKGGVCMHVRGR